jgi:Fe-S-cluster containining protein
MAPCDSCHAGCCRSFAVPVSGADIIAIERRFGLSFWDFVCRWADPTGRIAHDYAPHFFFPDAPETPFVICLSHQSSVFLPGTTKCRFLMECPPDEQHPLGQGRCGIYSSRPFACRVFPTRFNDTGDLAVIYDVPERVRPGVDPVYRLCPRQWEKSDVDPIESIQNLVVAKYEIAFFAQLARIWNQSPRRWEVFPDFLHLVYSNRIQREEDLNRLLANHAAARDGKPGSGWIAGGERAAA